MNSYKVCEGTYGRRAPRCVRTGRSKTILNQQSLSHRGCGKREPRNVLPQDTQKHTIISEKETPRCN